MAFLPGENKKIDTAQARDVSFDMMDFVEQVFNDEYALIIGSEVMLNPERVPLTGALQRLSSYPRRKKAILPRMMFMQYIELLLMFFFGVQAVYRCLPVG